MSEVAQSRNMYIEKTERVEKVLLQNQQEVNKKDQENLTKNLSINVNLENKQKTENNQDQEEQKTPVQQQNQKSEQQQSDQKPKSKMSINSFNILQSLGNGAFGEVIRVSKKETGQEYALKVVDKVFLQKEQKQYQVYMERGVLMTLNHVGLVKLNFSFQDKQNLYFGLDYVSGGDFANYLKLNFKNLVDSTIQFYIAEIILILEYLHANGIVHRDLKPENLILTSERHLKLIDFGTAAVFDDTICPPKILEAYMQSQSKKDINQPNEYVRERKTTLVGTAEYVSPELLEEDECSKPADLWALGIILYKMYHGKTPFFEQTEFLVFQKIKDGDFNFPDKMPEVARDLLQKLLKRQPSDRLGAGKKGDQNDYNALKAHPFFKNIKWDKIFQQEAPEREIYSPIKSSNQIDLQEYQMLYGQNKSNTTSPFPSPFPKKNEIFTPQSVKVHSADCQPVMVGLLKKKVGSFILNIYHNKQVMLFKNPPKIIYIDVDDKSKKEVNDPITNWIQKIKDIFQDYFNISPKGCEPKNKKPKKTSIALSEDNQNDESFTPPQQQQQQQQKQNLQQQKILQQSQVQSEQQLQASNNNTNNNNISNQNLISNSQQVIPSNQI